MNLLRYVREALTNRLWAIYRKEVKQALLLDEAIQCHSGKPWLIDHFAIIDLPSERSGLKVLKPLFLALGYEVRGEGYLSEKQNGFMWLAEVDAEHQAASSVLSQVVIADFELEALPDSVRKIIEKYMKHLPESPLAEVEMLSQKAKMGDQMAADRLIERLTAYFSEMDRPLPTVADFKAVESFNKLIAWCLAFGRRPNHFTVSVHALKDFVSLKHFNQWVSDQLSLSFNTKEGALKGGVACGIEQSSTQGESISVQLADGTVELSERFMEFVWRFPQKTLSDSPKWGDYFTGFIAEHANRIIESVYKEEA